MVTYLKTNLEEIAKLKAAWQSTVTAPQDDMWESFMDGGDIYQVREDTEGIGYVVLNDQNQVIQYFIQPPYLDQASTILQSFIAEHQVRQTILGTNNPVALSSAMSLQKRIQVHSLLFEDCLTETADSKHSQPRIALKEDLAAATAFCHDSMGAPEQWLTMYLGSLIENESLFLLENDGRILGSCEVRSTAPPYAHVGMIVSPESRRSGIGTYLLIKAKEIAISRGLQPVCSCERENTGSLKCIHAAGFRSKHQILQMDF